MINFDDTKSVDILINFAKQGHEELAAELKKNIASGEKINNDLVKRIELQNKYVSALSSTAEAFKNLRSVVQDYDTSPHASDSMQRGSAAVAMALPSFIEGKFGRELAAFNPGLSQKNFERQLKDAQRERDALSRLTTQNATEKTMMMAAERQHGVEMYQRYYKMGMTPLEPPSALTRQGMRTTWYPGQNQSRQSIQGSTLTPDESHWKGQVEILKRQLQDVVDEAGARFKSDGQRLTQYSAIGSQGRKIGVSGHPSITDEELGRLNFHQRQALVGGPGGGEYAASVQHKRMTPQSGISSLRQAEFLEDRRQVAKRAIRFLDDFDTGDDKAKVQMFADAKNRLAMSGYSPQQGDDIVMAAARGVVKGYQDTRRSEALFIEPRTKVARDRRLRMAADEILGERAASGLAGMTLDQVLAGQGSLEAFRQFHSADIRQQVYARAGVMYKASEDPYANKIIHTVADAGYIGQTGLLPNQEMAQAAAGLLEQRRLRAADEARKARTGVSASVSPQEMLRQLKAGGGRLRSNESGFISADALGIDEFARHLGSVGSFFRSAAGGFLDAWRSPSKFSTDDLLSMYPSPGSLPPQLGASLPRSRFEMDISKSDVTRQRILMGAQAGILNLQKKLDRQAEAVVEQTFGEQGQLLGQIDQIVKSNRKGKDGVTDKKLRAVLEDRVAVLQDKMGLAAAKASYFEGGAVDERYLTRVRSSVGSTASERMAAASRDYDSRSGATQRGLDLKYQQLLDKEAAYQRKKGVEVDPLTGLAHGGPILGGPPQTPTLMTYQTLALIGGATAIAKKGADILLESTRYAARTQEMGLVTTSMARQNGLDPVNVLQEVAMMGRNNITTQEAHRTVQKLMFSQIDLTKGPQLAQIAQNVAVMSGVDPAQALERITQGIVTGYTRQLHMMGLQINAQDVRKELVSKLGRQPTEIERRQALAEKVVDEGYKVTGNFEASLLAASRQAALLNVQSQETMNAVGGKFIPLYSDMIGKASNLMRYVRESPDGAKITGSLIASASLAGGAAGLMGAANMVGLTSISQPYIALTAGALAATSFIAMNRNPVYLTEGNIKRQLEDQDESFQAGKIYKAQQRRVLASYGERLSLNPETVSPGGVVTLNRDLVEQSMVRSRILTAGRDELAKQIQGESSFQYYAMGTGVHDWLFNKERIQDVQLPGGLTITADAIKQSISDQKRTQALVSVGTPAAKLQALELAKRQMAQQLELQDSTAIAQGDRKLESLANRFETAAARRGMVGPIGQAMAAAQAQIDEIGLVTRRIPIGDTGEFIDEEHRVDVTGQPGYIRAMKNKDLLPPAILKEELAKVRAGAVRAAQQIGVARLGLGAFPDEEVQRTLIGRRYTERVAGVGRYVGAYGDTMLPEDKQVEHARGLAEAKSQRAQESLQLDEQTIHRERSLYLQRRQIAGNQEIADIGQSPISEAERTNEVYRVRLAMADATAKKSGEEAANQERIQATVERINSDLQNRSRERDHARTMESSSLSIGSSVSLARRMGVNSLTSTSLRELQGIGDLSLIRDAGLAQNEAQFGIDSRYLGPDQARRNRDSSNLSVNGNFQQNTVQAQVQGVQSLRSRLSEMYDFRFQREGRLRELEADGQKSQFAMLKKNYDEQLKLIELKRALAGGGTEANITALRERASAVYGYQEQLLQFKNRGPEQVKGIAGGVFDAAVGGKLPDFMRAQAMGFGRQVFSNVAGMTLGGLPDFFGNVVHGQSGPDGKKTTLGKLLAGTALEERANAGSMDKEAAAVTKELMGVEEQLKAAIIDLTAALMGGTTSTGGASIPGASSVLGAGGGILRLLASSSSGGGGSSSGSDIARFLAATGATLPSAAGPLGSDPFNLLGGGGGGGALSGSPAQESQSTTATAAVVKSAEKSSAIAETMSNFVKGASKPSGIWDLMQYGSPNGSKAQDIGTVVGAAGVVYGGVKGMMSGIKSGGVKGYASAASSGLAMAAALDPEPISKAVLGIAAMATGMLSALMGDKRQERAQLVQDTLGRSQYAAPVSIGRSMDMFGMATSFDSSGKLRTTGFNAMNAKPQEPYVYQSPVDGGWHVIPGNDPGPFLPSPSTGPYPAGSDGPKRSPRSSAPAVIIHQNFQMLDGKDIMSRGHEFASAVEMAMRGNHPINERIQRVTGKL